MFGEEIHEAVETLLNSTNSYNKWVGKDGTMIGASRALTYIVTYGQNVLFSPFFKSLDELVTADLSYWYLALFFAYVCLYVIFLLILQCYTARRILTPIQSLTELIKNPAGLKNDKGVKLDVKPNDELNDTEPEQNKTQHSLNQSESQMIINERAHPADAQRPVSRTIYEKTKKTNSSS